MHAVALVTCERLPDLDPDDRALIGPLAELGFCTAAVVWNDPHIDWERFDLAVLRSPWDYTADRAGFVDWARSVPRLANRADVVEWNTDKRYLGDLAAAGVPVVPTTWFSPSDAAVLPLVGRHVLKPAIGAGALDAAAYSMGDAQEAKLAREHMRRLLGAGHTVMVQAYLELIEERGETGLIFIGGAFSHAISKGAMLGGDRRLEAGGLYREETIASRVPTAAQLEVAGLALAAVPGGPSELLYARVDIVPGRSGAPVIMELELTEPSLFMSTAPGSARRFAEAIAAHAARAGTRRNKTRPGARPSAASPASAGERVS